MKIVKNSLKKDELLSILLILILFYAFQNDALKQPNQIRHQPIDTVYINNIDKDSYIDYERDTLVYILNILEDEALDSFWVTKTLWVEDSCYGAYNTLNFKKAYKANGNISLRFYVDLIKNGIQTRICEFRNGDYSDGIRLEVGSRTYYQNHHYPNILPFLRIIQKTDDDAISEVSLNYLLNPDWMPISNDEYIRCSLISHEKIVAHSYEKKGYYIGVVEIEQDSLFFWDEMIDSKYWKYN